MNRDDGIFGHDASYIITFNTTEVHDSLTVLNVTFNFTTYTGDANIWAATRMNGTDINVNSDFSGNLSLVNAEGNYVPSWFVLTTHTNYEFGLGDDAITDMQDQLEDDYFTIAGDGQNVMGDDESFRINSSESSTTPILMITTDCSYGGSGDWIIATTCVMTGEEVTLASSDNMFVTPNGFLIMEEGSNVTFSGSGQFLNVEVGGKINVCTGCGLPK